MYKKDRTNNELVINNNYNNTIVVPVSTETAHKIEKTKKCNFYVEKKRSRPMN